MTKRDIDVQETIEWTEALASVYSADGADRVSFILDGLLDKAKQYGVVKAQGTNTPYFNTIPAASQAAFPGDLEMEKRIEAIVRWNAALMVVKAGTKELDLGGHIGSFASAATLYEVGFNHFWRASTEDSLGDLIFYQGHISPGIYSRSMLTGTISIEQANNFRQEAFTDGLSSYPHPWLMPTFWQFPTVSMGLGPIQAIYQARYMKYLESRGLIAKSSRKIWCFCGDGEMDEPESLGALSIAAREQLDNLIFVINCNLQRLDGPVRGNGKVIQEFESIFHGAKWQVIKVIWSSAWDSLLNADVNGVLHNRMQEVIDGDYQRFSANDANYFREHFFNTDELKQMVAHLSNDELDALQRGGHDREKVYAAYKTAVETQDKPSVILAKTVKGYGLGTAGEGQNIAHNAKKMTTEQLVDFKNRFNIPVTQQDIEELNFYIPSEDSPEIQYLKAKRQALNGNLPARLTKSSNKLTVPTLRDLETHLSGSSDREISTTMAFVRIIVQLCKDQNIGSRVVPIVPDEARTFGMEGLFRQFGIYSPKGQLYQPVDQKQVMFYKEAVDGQILQEGINEAGGFCSWLASATSYSVHNQITIPFYIFYSMFGFQRIMDLIWAAADSRARGFLLGATSGRTTLNGEGLQHEDGHSHVMASLIPNCVNYDPTFGYELTVIMQHGLKQMVEEQKDIFYYITLMNENYVHPAMPQNCEDGIIQGMYLFKKFGEQSNVKKVKVLSSGTIFNEALKAAAILEQEYSISVELFSVTSFTLLARQADECARFNRLNITAERKVPYVTSLLATDKAPVLAVTDYVSMYPNSIREHIDSRYVVLGTDGFGRSDSRANLRRHFEVNHEYIVVTALYALAEEKKIEANVVVDAMKKYAIDSNRVSPVQL